MTEREKMLAGKLCCSSDEELKNQRAYARKLVRRYNNLEPEETEEKQAMLRELLGAIGEYSKIHPELTLDYGCNIYLGRHCYINANCTLLDSAEIRLGDHVFIGPNCSVLTPLHPLLAKDRNHTEEHPTDTYIYAKPVYIEDNVWLCANVVVNPGVRISHDSVVGSGSVVTKDIPPGVFAAGNPCRVIRELTEQDSIESILGEQ